MIEPGPRTGHAGAGVGAGAAEAGAAEVSAAEVSAAEVSADTASALGALAVTLDRACDELFAAVPFPGDQATGASLNACIDEVVSALRGVRAEADDLRRVITIAEQRSRGAT